jgi:hypothetical protein
VRIAERFRARVRLCIAAGVGLVLCAAMVHAASRPIPEVVNLKVFVRLENGSLDLLVRVPLAAVKDIQFPTRGEAGYLDLEALASMLPGAADHWIAGGFEVFDHGEPASRPEVDQPRIATISDQSFDSYQSAIDHLGAPPVAATENLFLDQVWFDMRLRYRVASEQPAIAIDPKVAGWGVRVSTDLEIVDAGRQVRGVTFEGYPGRIYLAPRWTDAGRQFMDRGTRSSAAPRRCCCSCSVSCCRFAGYRPAIPPVVAFVSTLLIGCSRRPWDSPLRRCGSRRFSLRSKSGHPPRGVCQHRRSGDAAPAHSVRVLRRPDLRLEHGVGPEPMLQFGGSHPLVSVLAFCAGATATLVAAAAIMIPVMSYLFSRARTERIERIIVSALAADTAWGWLTERWSQLAKIPFGVVFETGAAAMFCARSPAPCPRRRALVLERVAEIEPPGRHRGSSTTPQQIGRMKRIGLAISRRGWRGRGSLRPRRPDLVKVAVFFKPETADCRCWSECRPTRSSIFSFRFWMPHGWICRNLKRLQPRR